MRTCTLTATLRFHSAVLSFILAIGWAAFANSAESKVINIGWTGGTAWTALPDRPAAERFYGIYRDQYNPDLIVPDSVVEEWVAVGTFRAKEKITVKPQIVYDWTFAERAKR